MINTNGMNVDDEDEVDCILAQADILVPDSSPEKMGTAGLPQFTLYAQKGWHAPRQGNNSRVQTERDSCQGSLCVFTWM